MTTQRYYTALGLVVSQYGSVFFFFFSSRRRHTRFDCDWSSDVCSSDLYLVRMDRRSGELLQVGAVKAGANPSRSEEHTSELQSQSNLVCRLLLEKKKHATNACSNFRGMPSSRPVLMTGRRRLHDTACAP